MAGFNIKPRLPSCSKRALRRLGTTLALVMMAIGATTIVATALSTDSIFKTGNTPWVNCPDDSGGTYGFCRTDNTSFTYSAFFAISPDGVNNIHAVMIYQIHPTDLNVYYQPTPTMTGGSETDVVFDRYDFTDGTAGLTYCDDPVDSEKCDQHYVLVDYATPPQRVVCHETGHAVGLTHGSNANPAVSDTHYELACMRTDAYAVPAQLGAHNWNQINGAY